MKTIAYIKGQWEWIASQAGIIILVNLILLTSTPLAKTLGEIFYLDLLMIFVAAAGYTFHYRRLNKAYTKIRQTMAGGLDIDWLFRGPSASAGKSVPGISLMKELLEYKNNGFSRKENDYRQRMNDLKDYLTQTVHDLKVNLSVSEMVVNRLENETDIANKLLFQIEQMKFRINQALSITRANHYSEDIISENVDLEQVVKEAIGDNAEFFIAKSINIQSNIRPYHFISDKKWIHYIVSQILNNSTKYTEKNGEMTISGQEDEWGYHLRLKDNGIGIPKEELGRVFDKGFTGSNGRNSTKSTGMGMYYAKKMADTLGIGLNIQSEQGVYTEFVLSFYKLSDYMQRQRL
ncbi:Sensor histidine kinase GraS [Pelotomaculum schinkii]|uniref:histidine kinase n=1 Tax=Pelotomaculum schinkii TaxID=78350 RepID=A0A4Y7RDT2_9FIRM|nr:sensor histidine kinase [Pelotomaculum schinkii]TEB07154.1 Sensor histidine kinase GraS [Pelotomaculum schinkii]